MFSSRTNWHRSPNRLTEALESHRKSGNPIFDLSISNPTECGIIYPEQDILSSLSHRHTLSYHPSSQGLLSAREAVAQYYREKSIDVDPEDIFLTASTSEAYSLLFKLLCNRDEHILVPQPSYPLFEYLAQVSDVHLLSYHLFYDHGWHIDVESIRSTITSSTKALVIVSPHNPTGMFLKKEEYQQLQEIARLHNVALIVDEVFLDYPFHDDPTRVGTTVSTSEVLTFTLNGISKSCGLPQMKLGWMVIGGERTVTLEARGRLEILCDTYLSVNTPVQIALLELFRCGKSIQYQILSRVKSNYEFLQGVLCSPSPVSLLESEGGWYAILKVPRTKSDEEWAMELLNEYGVYLFPGYFFDLQNEGYLVVSLLTQSEVFVSAINNLIHHISI